MSDNDVVGSAVKARKILAPDAKQKAEAKAKRAEEEAAEQAERYKAAAKANVDAIKAVNQRARQADAQATPNSKTTLALLRAAANKKRDMRSGRSTDEDAVSDPTVPMRAGRSQKTHAEKAREKLNQAAMKAAQQQPRRSPQQINRTTDAIRSQLEYTRRAQAKMAQKQQVDAQARKGAPVQGAQSKPSTAQEAQLRRNAAQQAKSQFQDSAPKNQLVRVPQQPGSSSTEGRSKNARPIINATALLAAKYPNYFADHNDSRTKAESRVVFVVASMILSIIAMGWYNWRTINFQVSGDFTYNSGLIGGIMMLCVLLYALRKRLKLLRRAGNMEVWYYFHLLGGVLGPLIIVFHTGFEVKSINSGVALFTMITIVLSGVFGRYIYTRIGYSLHRKLLSIKEAEGRLLETLHSYDSPLSDKIERRLSNFALSVLTGPRSILKLPMRMVAIRGAATACYVKVNGDLSSIVKSKGMREGWPPHEIRGRIFRNKELLRAHINAVAQIAHAHLFERVLVKWRILHIPLLYILVITGLFHVLAVHMY